MADQELVQSLVAQCRSGSSLQRCAALADLEELGAREAVQAIVELVEFPDAGVRANLAAALGVLGSEATALSPLLALSMDPDSLVRLKAVESLGRFPCAASGERLISVLQSDEDPLVRVHATEALAAFDDDHTLGALMVTLDDPDEGVRAYAADTIGARHGAAGSARLRERLDGESSLFARAFILSALYRLGQEDALWSLVASAASADDRLAATILNLAAELATPSNAGRLAGAIAGATRDRPDLHAEAQALLARIRALMSSA